MTDTSPPVPELPETVEEQTGPSLTRIVTLVAIALGGIIVVTFVAGVLLALLSDAEQTAPVIQVIRDIFIIILVFQGILIVGALAVLILQVARLINLLQNEIMPILNNTKDTVQTAKGTVEFVGSNLAEPVIRFNGFFTAILVLVRELFGIRRALRTSSREMDAVDANEAD